MRFLAFSDVSFGVSVLLVITAICCARLWYALSRYTYLYMSLYTVVNGYTHQR